MPGDPAFYRLLDEMRDLHASKSADYASESDPLGNYRVAASIGIEPWKCCFSRVLEKVNRVKAFTRNGRLENESLEDALKDIACCAMLSLVLFREKAPGPVVEIDDPTRPDTLPFRGLADKFCALEGNAPDLRTIARNDPPPFRGILDEPARKPTPRYRGSPPE